MKVLLLIFLALTLAATQALIGGAKMVYGMPCYAMVGTVGLLAFLVPWKGSVGSPRWVCFLSMAALAGYGIWKSLTSPVEYLARPDFFMIGAAVVFYLLGSVHLASTRDRLTVLWILFVFALVHIAVGAVQFKQKDNFMLLPWLFRPDYGFRASGFYICPNHLAGLLEMLLLFAVSIAIWGRVRPWVRVAAGYVAVSCVVGVAITGSRGGYLSVAGGLTGFGLLTLVIVRRTRPRLFYPLLAIVLAGVVSIIGASVWFMKHSEQLSNRLGQIYDPTNMRLHMWRAALKTHQLSPEIATYGAGSGTYLYYGRRFRDQSVQNDPQHVHNDYLELLVEYGRIGAGLMAVFLIAHGWSGVRGLRSIVRRKIKGAWESTSNELAVIIGCLGAFGAILFHSAIDFNLHIPANTMLVAFMMGILSSPQSSDEDGSKQAWSTRWWLRVPTPLVGGALIFFALPRIRSEYYGERARMALRDQMNPESLAFAEKAIALDPANPNTYYYRGEAKHNQAMATNEQKTWFQLETEAVQDFSTGLNHFPMDLQLLLKMGRTLDNLRRFDEAERIYRIALRADPNFSNVYSYYGYHYFLQHRLKRAEILYKKALELTDQDVAPRGLEDIRKYREAARNEDTSDDHPIEDEYGDEDWVPGEDE